MDASDSEVKAHVETIRMALTDIRKAQFPDDPGIVTDAVVVYAVREFTAEGGSRAHVSVVPLDEFQPDYVTQGLLYTATDMVAGNYEVSED